MSSDQFWGSLTADLSLQLSTAACCFFYLSSDVWNSTRRHEACVQQLGCGNHVMMFLMHFLRRLMVDDKFCSSHWPLVTVELLLYFTIKAPLHTGVRGQVGRNSHKLNCWGKSVELCEDLKDMCPYFSHQLWSAEVEPLFQVKPFQKHELFNNLHHHPKHAHGKNMFWKSKLTLVVTVWLSTTSTEELNQTSNMVQTDMEQINVGTKNIVLTELDGLVFPF